MKPVITRHSEGKEPVFSSCLIVTLDNGAVFRGREDVFLIRGDDQTRDGELVSSKQADFSRIWSDELHTMTQDISKLIDSNFKNHAPRVNN